MKAIIIVQASLLAAAGVYWLIWTLIRRKSK
jgi:hypothetical protein